MNPNFIISSKKKEKIQYTSSAHISEFTLHFRLFIFIAKNAVFINKTLRCITAHPQPQTHTMRQQTHFVRIFYLPMAYKPYTKSHILRNHPHWTHKALLLLDILANISCHCSLYIIILKVCWHRVRTLTLVVFRRADGRPIKMNRYLHSVNSHLLYALSSSQWRTHAMHKTTQKYSYMVGGNRKT